MSEAPFPYDSIAEHQKWRTAVSARPRATVDPQGPVRFRFDEATRVASAGSCFAKRIARQLRRYGLNYLDTEPGPPWLTQQERLDYNYGVVSARYGNVYTPAQLNQLFDRAYGRFVPSEDAWACSGGFVDPFRPLIQPEGFVDLVELHADRAGHLAAVRRVFSKAEVFVFTFGLTEAWCARSDGAVLPMPPGRVGGTFDPDRFEFRNFGVAENCEHLSAFLANLHRVNPAARVILSVSPVPIAATMEHQHVVRASAYTKSVLRVVAEEIVRKHEFVDYFASYEIATQLQSGVQDFGEGGRTVSEELLDRVMASFFRNFMGRELAEMTVVEPMPMAPETVARPCDEEMVLRAIDRDFAGA